MISPLLHDDRHLRAARMQDQTLPTSVNIYLIRHGGWMMVVDDGGGAVVFNASNVADSSPSLKSRRIPSPLCPGGAIPVDQDLLNPKTYREAGTMWIGLSGKSAFATDD